jgi:hypothetical protein
MEKKTGEKRGAPRGNRNAAKHDFYARVLDETERFEFQLASGVEGIDEEIALLRLEIKKAISGGDEKNLLLLVKAAGALEKLIRTHYQITSTQRQGLKEAINTVFKDVLVPLGINIGSAVITKKLSG